MKLFTLILSIFSLSTFCSFAQNSVVTYEEAIRLKNNKNDQEKLFQSIKANPVSVLDLVPAESQNSSNKSNVLPPANDDCANAISLTIGGGDVTYSNVGATVAGTDPVVAWPSCAGGPGNNVQHSVWFKFTVAGGPLNITVSSQGPNLNNNASVDKALYSVFSGVCGAFTQIGTTRVGSYGSYNSKSINIASLANGTYYIMTDGLCSQTGNYRIRVDVTPSGSPTLWYAAGAIPTLSTGINITTGGQWGTYAATTELSPSCGAAGLGFSDWYQFVYNSATQNHIGILDHALQSGFYIGLYNSAGTQIVCNKWGQADYPSYTWAPSAQEGIAMHMPNISLRELGLVNGATYYVRIASTSSTAENVNATVNKIYTVRLGNFAPSGDSYLDNVSLSLTQQPTYIWLTGQTNRFSGHSMLTEPEQGNLAWNIDNSLLYTFNTGSATAVSVNFQNMTYYNHLSSTALGQVAILTSPTAGTSMGSNSGFLGASFVLKGTKADKAVVVTGLTANTNYWILVDGGGSFEGTKLTFDIAVSTTQPLPITLVDFSGTWNGSENIIKWETASEINNDFFTLERTFDGTNYEEVAKVNAIKDRQNNSYSFIDQFAYSNTAYYRLKQTDIDGQSTYSKLIEITHNDAATTPVIISPNPANGNFVNVHFNTRTEGLATMNIYSITGQLLLETQMLGQKGNNNVELKITDLAKGIYFLTFLNDNNFQKVKFVKD